MNVNDAVKAAKANTKSKKGGILRPKKNSYSPAVNSFKSKIKIHGSKLSASAAIRSALGKASPMNKRASKVNLDNVVIKRREVKKTEMESNNNDINKMKEKEKVEQIAVVKKSPICPFLAQTRTKVWIGGPKCSASPKSQADVITALQFSPPVQYLELWLENVSNLDTFEVNLDSYLPALTVLDVRNGPKMKFFSVSSSTVKDLTLEDCQIEEELKWDLPDLRTLYVDPMPKAKLPLFPDKLWLVYLGNVGQMSLNLGQASVASLGGQKPCEVKLLCPKLEKLDLRSPIRVLLDPVDKERYPSLNRFSILNGILSGKSLSPKFKCSPLLARVKERTLNCSISILECLKWSRRATRLPRRRSILPPTKTNVFSCEKKFFITH